MKQYCLGFACDPATREVVLIEKRRPDWQAGLFNGIGGKCEGVETPLEAMIRECVEETGLEDISWTPIGAMGESDWKVTVFVGTGVIAGAASLTDEQVVRVGWDEVMEKPLVRDVENIWSHVLAHLARLAEEAQ
jgi:8-oxo-dGTP pyrophosphatase MutT (NUDIX family)